MPVTSADERPLAPLLQDFFLERLIRQRRVSPCTVASYRDAFKLLLPYIAKHQGTRPENLALADLDAPAVLGFLDHLETERGNSTRTRNLRLTAIHSFLHFAAYQSPTDLPSVRRVLGVPMKRCDRVPVDYLTREEIQALLDAADISTWCGQRDWILLQMLYNTGARVSEATAITIGDVDLGNHPYVRIHGKGRKDRSVPLWAETRRAIRRWLTMIDAAPERPLLPDRAGHRLSRSGATSRLIALTRQAVTCCPSLQRHRVAPHLIRHSTAMHLLQAGVDLSVIAMWLGHESIETTHQYLEADLALKRKAIETIDPPDGRARTFQVDDRLLRFLEAL